MGKKKRKVPPGVSKGEEIGSISKEIPTVVFQNPDGIMKRSTPSSSLRSGSNFERRAHHLKDEGAEGPPDMKQTRWEIMKFSSSKSKSKGSSGTSTSTKGPHTPEELLAIELGAIPEKRKGINYKELIKERKQDKLEKLELKKEREGHYTMKKVIKNKDKKKGGGKKGVKGRRK